MNLKSYHSNLTELLESALISLCCESLPSDVGIEIDGLICVSLADVDQQIVVKIHKLIAPQCSFIDRSDSISNTSGDDGSLTDISFIGEDNCLEKNHELIDDHDGNIGKTKPIKLENSSRPKINRANSINGVNDRIKQCAFTKNNLHNLRIKEGHSKHLEGMSDELRTCTLCHKKFNSYDEYGEHVTEKHGLYGCHKCPKLFTAVSNLKRHVKLHLGIKQYKCHICHMAFARNYYLTQHMKKHKKSGEFAEKNRNVHKDGRIIVDVGKDSNVIGDVIDNMKIKIENHNCDNDDDEISNEGNNSGNNVNNIDNTTTTTTNDNDDDGNEHTTRSSKNNIDDDGNAVVKVNYSGSEDKPVCLVNKIISVSINSNNNNNDDDNSYNGYASNVNKTKSNNDNNNNQHESNNNYNITCKVEDVCPTMTVNSASNMKSILKRKLSHPHHEAGDDNDDDYHDSSCHSDKKERLDIDRDHLNPYAYLKKIKDEFIQDYDDSTFLDATNNSSSNLMETTTTTSSPKSPTPSPSIPASTTSPYTCCNQTWSTFTDYETHCFKVHNRYPCEGCSQTFTCKNNKRRHYNCYHGDKREVMCNLCLKKFSRTDIMKEHRLTHTISYKENKCQVCKFFCDKKAVLINHLKKCFRENNANFLNF